MARAMTPKQRAALRKAQLASAAKRRRNRRPEKAKARKSYKKTKSNLQKKRDSGQITKQQYKKRKRQAKLKKKRVTTGKTHTQRVQRNTKIVSKTASVVGVGLHIYARYKANEPEIKASGRYAAHKFNTARFNAQKNMNQKMAARVKASTHGLGQIKTAPKSRGGVYTVTSAPKAKKPRRRKR